MHSKQPGRNRLAKVLPEEWRKLLVEHGVPKRKYTAVIRAELVGGRVIDEMIVEEGWIIASFAAYRSELAHTRSQIIAANRAAQKNGCDAPKKP